MTLAESMLVFVRDRGTAPHRRWRSTTSACRRRQSTTIACYTSSSVVGAFLSVSSQHDAAYDRSTRPERYYFRSLPQQRLFTAAESSLDARQLALRTSPPLGHPCAQPPSSALWFRPVWTETSGCSPS